MKRTCSLLPDRPESKRPKILGKTRELTTDALYEHDQCYQPLSPSALFAMVPQEKTPSLADVPIIPPPSTSSSQRSRSSSPSRPSDAQYRVNHLRRANIFLDDDTPADIWTSAKEIFQGNQDDAYFDQLAERFWAKSKELAKKPSGEAEWTEILHMLIDELKAPELEIVRN